MVILLFLIDITLQNKIIILKIFNFFFKNNIFLLIFEFKSMYHTRKCEITCFILAKIILCHCI